MTGTHIIDIAIALFVTMILYKVIGFLYSIDYILLCSPTKRRELKVQQFMNSYKLCKKKEIVEHLVLSKKELSVQLF